MPSVLGIDAAMFPVEALAPIVNERNDPTDRPSA